MSKRVGVRIVCCGFFIVAIATFFVIGCETMPDDSQRLPGQNPDSASTQQDPTQSVTQETETSDSSAPDSASDDEHSARSCFAITSGGGPLRDAAGRDRGFAVIGQPIIGVMRSDDYTIEAGFVPCLR